jgi:hypothetical protein
MIPKSIPASIHFSIRQTRRLFLLVLLAIFAALPVVAQGPNLTYTIKTNIKGVNGTSVAADSAGNVFVANANSSAVSKETPQSDGSYTQSTISTGAAQAFSVAIDSSDNLYVADGAQTVYKETLSNGNYIESTVANTFTNAYSLAVDNAGDVYVLDAGTGTVYLEKLSGGTYIRSTVVGGLNISGGGGIAVDSAGNVYIAETANKRALKEMLSGGTYTQSIVEDSSTFNLDSLTVSPDGIAVDSTGAVILATQNYGIFKASPNGASYTTTPVYFAPNLKLGSAGFGLSIDVHGNLYIAGAPIIVTAVNELAESSSGENFGSQNVGTTAAAQTATFTFDVGGTLATVPYAVSTQGDLTLDFQPAATQAANVCIAGQAYNAGDVCTVAATFSPTRPGARYGAIALFAPSGTPIATSYLQGIGLSPQVSFSPGSLSGAVGETFGGAVTVDSSNNVSYGDVLSSFTAAHPPLIITPSFSTGYTGSNGYASTSSYGNPFGDGNVIDGAGNIVYADGFTASAAVQGVTSFSAYAVNPTTPSQQMSGGQIIATNYGYAFLASVPLTSPSVAPPYNNRPAVDGAGNLYFSDDNQNRILEQQYVHGAYNNQLVVATGLNNPGDVVVDGAGAVYAIDSGNNRIVKETPSGSGNYTQTVVDSNFSAPLKALGIDRVGNLYVTIPPTGSITPFVIKETLSNGSYTQSNLAIFGTSGVDVNGAGDVVAVEPGAGGFNAITELDVSTPPSFIFAATPVGSTSADSPQTVTLVNNGNAPLNFSGNLAITAGFTLSPSSTCTQAGSATLAPEDSCTLLINFVPTQSGLQNGTLTVTDNHLNAAAATQVIKLNGQGTGSGTVAATLTPASLSFSGTAGSLQAASQIATLTNTGSLPLSISSVAVSGANAASFTETSSCDATLAVSSSCTIAVSFSGTVVGGYVAALTVSDNAATPTQTAALAGTVNAAPAPAAALTPGSLTYSATTATTSAAQTATLTNSGTAVLSISGITLTGTDASEFAIGANSCGSALAVGASCTISITFSPTAAGSFTASLLVTDAVGTQTSTLAGTGTAVPAAADFTVAATPSAQSVTSGNAVSYTLLIASTGNTFTDAVTLMATGLPPGASVTFSPASVTPGTAGAQATMNVQTAAQKAASTHESSPSSLPTPSLAALLLLIPGWRTRKRWNTKANRVFTGLGCLLVLFGMMAAITGCGGGFALPQTSTSYTITVTGTSGSVQHSTAVQITVK